MAGKCPCCAVKLTRVMRQGFGVFHCEQCHGHLVTSKRLRAIQCLRMTPVEELEQEVLSESGKDSKAILRCPECHHRMGKKVLRAPASFVLDVCDHCHTVWLDGGELARLQLTYRASQQGQEMAELQRRRQEMPPEQKAAVDKKLASLEDNPNEKSDSDTWWQVANVLLTIVSEFPIL